MKDLMVDIETLGTNHNAVIIQIGACFFDRITGEIGQTYLMNIDIQSCLDIGLEVDGDTIQWWLSQSKETIDSVFSTPISIKNALNAFILFIKRADKIWSHATFDFVIIQNSLKKYGMKQIPYRKARDIRTLIDLAGSYKKTEKIERAGIHHNALDDCIYQVEYCVNAMKKLKENI